jgi:branched-chain amino acid transport system substrate-binding protein
VCSDLLRIKSEKQQDWYVVIVRNELDRTLYRGPIRGNKSMNNKIIACASSFAMTLALWFTTVQAEIKIGIAGPLSGSALSVGEQQEIGGNRAIADLNAKGGVLGEQILVISVDDACDPEQAKAAARELVNEGVVFVLGHVCSGASIAASKIYQDAGIIMISPASTNPKVTDGGFSNVFRVIGRDDNQGVVAGNYLADKYADKNIGIVHDGQAYGQGLAEFTKRQLNKRSVKEVLYATYTADQDEYSPLIAKMTAAKIDVLYAGGYQGDIGVITREAHATLPDLKIVGGDSLSNNEYIVTAGEAGIGTYFTFGPDIRLRTEAIDVVVAFRDEDDFEPEGYTLFAYGAVQTWAKAAEQAGSTDAAKISSGLKSNSFQTILGKIGFDKKGDVTGISSFVWYEFDAEDFKLAK